ncbi:MAG: ABC transporter ATP-binding protein [Lachnospiraceae bacterium]|nr:ABC transporter ATP-binding protein [Lachnospiraceae bacterium]
MEEMNTQRDELLVCRNLTKQYGKVTALDGIDLTLKGGRIVGLLGPNGSGKTTLIKLSNRLLQPTSGEILIDGKKPGVESKRVIAYLPDKDFLPDWMTAPKLTEFYADFYADFDMDKALQMLEELDIPRKMIYKKMSKGTKEKVQLILTMSRRAKIYLLDEPIAGVDPAARDYILKTIIGNYAPDSLVVISTHLIADVEPVLDEAVFIKNGHIVLHRNTDDLRDETGMSIDGYFREVFKC